MTSLIQKRRLNLQWHGYHALSTTTIERVGVPSDAGVYKLAMDSGDSYTVFYVGQASDLASRLGQHARRSDNECVRGKVAKQTCYFSYALVGRAEDRDGAERQLYLFFRPECNDPDAIPSGPNIEINPRNNS